MLAESVGGKIVRSTTAEVNSQYGRSEVQPSEAAYTLLGAPQAEPECNVPKGGRRVSF